MTTWKNGKYHLLLFLVNPVMALFLSIRDYRSEWFRFLLMLVVSFLGFTAFSEGDLASYQEWFYEREGDLYSLFNEVISFNSGDFYVDILEYVVGIFFESHRFYFIFLFGVFGYLYSSILFELYKLIPQKLTYGATLLVVSVALYFSIRYTLSMRFYTGALFYILMIFRCINYSKRKYLFAAALAPVFHIGLTVLVFSIPLILVLENRHVLAGILVLVSYVIGQSTVVDFIEKQTRKVENVEVERRVRSYVSDEGRELMDIGYAKGAAKANWKLNFLTTTRFVIWSLINIGVFLIFYYRKKLLVYKEFTTLFTAVLVTWSFSNLLLNISNGDRFMIIYTFLALCLFLVVYVNVATPSFFRIYISIVTPAVLVFDLMMLYAANPIFGANFFLSNYFFEFIDILSNSLSSSIPI